MSFLHTLANPLSQDQKQSVAKKFRDILDDMTTPLLLAIQYAHTYGNPPVKREEIWKNLFIPPKKELLDPTRYSPSKPPANIYQDWDIQLVLKYLYFGGQRITSFSPVKRYAQDQECYFDFFRIEHRYLALKPPADDPVGLFAGDYSRALFQAITLRNTTYHNTQSNVEEFTVAGCAAFVEHLSVLLRPLCGAVSWDQTGMEQAQKLLKKMWPGVCNAMGEVSYPIAGILEYLRIPSTEQTVAEQMLMDAGFTVNQGYLAVCGDVDELAYGLLYAWKVGQQIGKEYGVELLSQCRERLLAWLTPNQEEKVQEQKDWKTMPLDALEALAKKDHVEAQYHLACRLLHGEEKADHALTWIYLQKSANLGYAPAQVQMGMHLEDGTCGQQRNWKEAFAWYKKAAEQNDADGLCRLGMCYENGVGVECDIKQAASCYKLAKDQGSQTAKIYEASLQLSGAGETDKTAALVTLRTFAEEGVPLAQAKLGECYLKGLGVEKNDAVGFDYVTKAAASDERTGQYWLGWCYEEGICKGPNNTIAQEWYFKAAVQGHVEAQLKCVPKLSENYPWLESIAQEGAVALRKKALRRIVRRSLNGHPDPYWAEQSAEMGDEYAALSLVNQYIDKDIHKALYYFELAAKTDGDVWDRLVTLYQNGYLDLQYYEDDYYIFRQCTALSAIDVQKAQYWLEWAAEQGNNSACLEAAQYYLSNNKVWRAIQWYELAGSRGRYDAYCKIAELYMEGKFVTKDVKKAVYWYDRAGQNGYDAAYRMLAKHCLDGKYVKQNREVAIRYYLKGLEQATKSGTTLKPDKRQDAVMKALDPYLQPEMPTEVVQAARRELEKMAGSNGVKNDPAMAQRVSQGYGCAQKSGNSYSYRPGMLEEITRWSLETEALAGNIQPLKQERTKRNQGK